VAIHINETPKRHILEVKDFCDV